MTTLWFLENLSLNQVLNFFQDLDVVIVEGFKFEKGFPKILVGLLEEDIKNPIKEEIVLTVEGKEDYQKVLSWILERLNLQVDK
jgi:molybdopterin-guanine dinucleotide biosynthesis protein